MTVTDERWPAGPLSLATNANSTRNGSQSHAMGSLAGLSFPVTLLWALRALVSAKAATAAELLRVPNLRIVAAGCSHRLEQRILEQTSYFDELQTYLPHTKLELVMLGPEIRTMSSVAEKQAASDSLCWHRSSDAYSWATWQGTLKQFLQVCIVAMLSHSATVASAGPGHTHASGRFTKSSRL